MTETKKIFISILIVVAFILSRLSGDILIEFTDYSSFSGGLQYIAYGYLMVAPLTILTVYIYFTLRKRVVFKILMFITIIVFVLYFIAVLFDYYHVNTSIVDLADMFSSVTVFVILSLIAIYTKESILTTIYLCLSIFPTITLTLFIYYKLNIFRVGYSIIYFMIAFIGLIILLIIYNKDKTIEISQ